MRFGETFRCLLKERGLTQVEAAKLLDVKQATVSYYCNAVNAPRTRTLRYIAERLGIGIEKLTGEVPAGPRGKKATSKTAATSLTIIDQFPGDALAELRHRWKRTPTERNAIKHLVAMLFPDKSDKVVAWLEKP
jgi:transcriptional regulator with XRE-family HTH domain